MNNFMKKNQPYINLNYDFSDYAEEITGNVLFKLMVEPK